MYRKGARYLLECVCVCIECVRQAGRRVYAPFICTWLAESFHSKLQQIRKSGPRTINLRSNKISTPFIVTVLGISKSQIELNRREKCHNSVARPEVRSEVQVVELDIWQAVVVNCTR